MLRRLTTRLPLRPLQTPALRSRSQFLATSSYCTYSEMPDPSDRKAVTRYLEQTHDKIFESNRAWVASKKGADPEFFNKLAAGQSPEYLYIGCSDSRVPANEIMGLDAGEVFVHRNIANVVPTIDLSSMSVINYAVGHLKVKHIVVCGHYNCGGVQAALTPTDLGILNPWLRNIRDVYRLHEKELDAIEDDGERFNRLVELNVIESCRSVIKTAVVQQSYEENGFPIVHGWVFNLKDGLLKDLNIDFPGILADIQKIYNLTKGSS
ncbi:protein canB [Aspergillus nidulans FGSC A4]|nr:protein canB [Aspergillus nidulans FGSC A4]CBF85595.1 TPA: Carbonic anhydrase (EC 4.2.1.1)(Carbonate dehydratase) [Source:UniProtKB/Swiss-Prot;Acc:Q5BCC5] [Aspergillus nidulans FGSC A4]